MKNPAGVTFIAIIICVIGSLYRINANPWGRQLGGGGGRTAFGIPGMDFIFRTKDDCLLPKKIGSCRAMIPSFYFDQQKNKCSFFAYGGCQGNSNRFNTYEECRALCERTKYPYQSSTANPSEIQEMNSVGQADFSGQKLSENSAETPSQILFSVFDTGSRLHR